MPPKGCWSLDGTMSLYQVLPLCLTLATHRSLEAQATAHTTDKGAPALQRNKGQGHSQALALGCPGS